MRPWVGSGIGSRKGVGRVQLDVSEQERLSSLRETQLKRCLPCLPTPLWFGGPVRLPSWNSRSPRHCIFSGAQRWNPGLPGVHRERPEQPPVRPLCGVQTEATQGSHHTTQAEHGGKAAPQPSPAAARHSQPAPGHPGRPGAYPSGQKQGQPLSLALVRLGV